MILTREMVDFIAPEHSRISCSDENPSNFHGGWNGKYNVNNGEKDIDYPRCVRCYLLKHIGEETSSLEFGILPILVWKEQK